jgi:hypothetical protein
MADLNTTYNGVLEYFDPKADSGIPNPSTWNWFGFGGSNFWMDETPFWPELNAINNQSGSTLNAVKIPYRGTSATDRLAWVNERINAINERVKFIKGRTDQLLTKLQAQSTDSFNALTKVVTSALSLVPVVGTAVTFVQAQATSAQTLEQYKVQSLIQDYANDLKELATIRTQLLKELVVTDPDPTPAPTGPQEPTQKAPTAIPVWYYYAGAGLLLLLLLGLRNQQRR